MVRNLSFLIGCLVAALLVATPAYAWLAPRFSLGSGYSSLESEDISGAKYRTPSITRLDFKPEFVWIDRATYSEFALQAKAQYFKFGPPTDDTALGGNPVFTFGSAARYSFPVSSWVASLGADYSEVPVIEVVNPIELKFKKVAVLTIPVDLTFRLMAIESQAIRVGGGGFYAIPNSAPQITGGNGYQIHFSYEYRGSIKSELVFYIDSKSFDYQSTTQKSSEFGFNLSFSFLGPQGRTPPPDERGL